MTTSGLETGLPIQEIEARLCDAAKRHHLAERNIAYWLLEIDERGLHRQRGFASIGDYAMELVGIKPRKAQYLVFIASRLKKLPKIRAVFDGGELSWTKAREIASVATPETEAEWLGKARTLSNRALEKEVRRHAGQTSGGFATVTISMPVEVLEMWNDAYELAERISGTELEKWQVLEPSLAEFLGTHLPIGVSVPETGDENDVPDPVRSAVLERDGWQCAFPSCTMRKMLDVHHIVFRSRGGSDEPENLICLCRIHHGLVHRGICKLTGKVGVDLKFERPQLSTATTSDEPLVSEPSPASHEAEAEDDESWREQDVADIFDGPPLPKPEPRFKDYNDFLDHWVAQKTTSEMSDRAHKRRASFDSRAHVCAERDGVDSAPPYVLDGPPDG